MIITLENFKCWENKTIDLRDDIFTLISGKSGTGKTTILEAIVFAMYGNRKKMTSYGKKSCSVTIEYKDMKIIRTKNPNIVKLYYQDNEYEDDAAQAIINKRFGENFDVTGYIRQGINKSFITMGAQDKLSFLERFAFQDVELIEIKKKAADIIHERNDYFVEINSRINTIKDMLDVLEKPEVTEFPIKCKPESRDKAIKNNSIKLKNTNVRIKKLKTAYNAMSETINYSTIYHDKVEMNRDRLNSIKTKLDEMNEELQDIDLDVMMSDLHKYKHQLETIDNNREYNELVKQYESDQKQYDELLIQETDKVNNEIDKIEKKLWVDYSRDEINENIETYQDLVNDLKKINDLTSQIDDIEVTDEDFDSQISELTDSIKEKHELISRLKLEKETLTCPSCDERLLFKNGALVKNTNEKCEYSIDKETERLASLNKKLSKKRKKRDEQERIKHEYNRLVEKRDELYGQYDIFEESKEFDIDDYEAELNEYIMYRDDHSQLERELNRIKMKDKSDTLKTLDKKLGEMRSRIEQSNIFDDNLENTDNLDENEIRDEVALIKSSIPKYQMMFNDVDNLNNESDEIKRNLEKWEADFIEKYKKVRNPDEFKQKRDEIEKEIEEKELEKEKLQNIQIDIEKFIRGEKSVKEYNKWKSEHDELVQEESEAQIQLKAAKEFKQKIFEAESIAITNVITTINKYAEKYLDAFFPDNSIVINLNAFKHDTKNQVKPQVNLQIVYKDCECDIDNLSGGELQRVIVAFNLALAEMFDTEFLLLDECTSNLDQETTNLIMNAIKSNFNDKHVIIIAHQVVMGIFDYIIKI